MGKKVVHGARVLVFFGATKIGVMSTITENEDYGLQGAYAIGQMEPFELVALRFSGNFNFNSLVLTESTIADMKFGERAGKTVKDIVKSILTQEGFIVVLQDKYTEENIATISGCKIGNLSLSVGENAITQRSGSGMYGEPVNSP